MYLAPDTWIWDVFLTWIQRERQFPRRGALHILHSHKDGSRMSLSLFLQTPGLCSQVWEVVTASSVPCKSQILLLVLIPGKLWDTENIDLHNGLSDENTGILLKTTQTSGKDNSQRSGSFKRETGGWNCLNSQHFTGNSPFTGINGKGTHWCQRDKVTLRG